MRCAHKWVSQRIKAGAIYVTVLKCRNCPERLVQTYPNRIGLGRRHDIKERRLAAAEKVRRAIASAPPQTSHG